MSLNANGTLEKIEVQGPIAGKNGKADYDRVLFTVGDQTFSKLTNVNADLDVHEGDNVHIFYTSVQNGKFTNNNVIKIEKASLSNSHGSSLNSSPSPTKSQSKRLTAQSGGSLGLTTSTSSTVNSVSVSKDTSMEVSGLLQALINSEGLTSETEAKLREALTIKRAVAQELELKGSV